MSPDLGLNQFQDIEDANAILFKGWAVAQFKYGFNQECHIIPEDDTWEHKFDALCSCRPTKNPENSEFGDVMYTHNAWDGREFIQEGNPAIERHRLD